MQAGNQSIEKKNDSDDCLSASDLVRRHLQNKDHKISDEELKQVELNCNETTATTTANLSFPDKTSAAMNGKPDTDDDKDDYETPDTILTPLDVIH